MNITLIKTLFGVLCLLLLGAPAVAQAQDSQITCTATINYTYPAGIRTTGAGPHTVIVTANLITCISLDLINPGVIPSALRWVGTVEAPTCGNIGGTGDRNTEFGGVRWNNGTTDSIVLNYLTAPLADADLGAITIITDRLAVESSFSIQTGHRAGYKVVLTGAVFPSDTLFCSDQNPVRALTGVGTAAFRAPD